MSGRQSFRPRRPVALDHVYGPLYHRLLHGHAPLNDRFVRDVVDAVLAGLGVVWAP
jgi:hypothetical protein